MLKRSTFVLLLLIVAGVYARPADREFTASSLKALGAPNNPKVEVAWNRYYDSKELAEIGARIARAFPSLASLSSIGKSVEGKDIWLLTVTNKKTGEHDTKPAIYIDGNIHSNEIQGSEVALYTGWYLTEMYGKVEWITQLLDEKTLYIVPTINPDGRDFFIHQANTAHSPRTGMDPRDDDGDGLVDEDGYDDLDGDGNIVQMRIKDPNGRWVVDPDEPRLLIPAKADQPGSYTMLGWEGIDNDGDGQVNEDGPGFYDPNRNWAWNWAPRYVQYGADKYPFSLPESRAVAQFFYEHDNIAAAQTYHNSGGMILRGPGTKEDTKTYKASDLQAYDFLARTGEEMIPGYRYLIVHRDLYPVYGGELDWFYAGRGVITFSNELWTSIDLFRKKPDPGKVTFSDGPKDTYRFDRLLLFGEGIVSWKPIDHPVYGKIEIGGVKKAWTRTAPSFLLEEMCHRNMAFTLFHAYHTPKVAVDSVTVRELQGGITEVTALVKNTRIIPTRTGVDVENKITRPDFVSLTGGKVIAGSILENRFTGQAIEQKRNPQRMEVKTIPGMGVVAVRWLVQGKGPFTITIDSAKGGKDSKRVN